MASAAKTGVTSASPWALVLVSPFTAWATLAVTIGIALTIAGPASMDPVGFGLACAGLVALAAIVLHSAWRAQRLDHEVVTRSGHLVAIAVVVVAPLVVAVVLTAASAPSVTNVGLALPLLGVLAGLSNRVRVRTVPAGSLIVVLVLAVLATVVVFRAVVGRLESLLTDLAVAALAGVVALAVVGLVVTLLTVLLRPASELSD